MVESYARKSIEAPSAGIRGPSDGARRPHISHSEIAVRLALVSTIVNKKVSNRVAEVMQTSLGIHPAWYSKIRES